jgi:sugar-specific transcriptional regulator TrmB
MNENDQSNTLLAVIRRAGLTESQAKAYLFLVEHGASTPIELAEGIGESRTNGYMITEKLEDQGLIVKNDGKKLSYSPLHPSKIELLAEKRRKTIERSEQAVKKAMPELIDFYNASQHSPGVTTHYGADGPKVIYDKILSAKQPLMFVRSPQDDHQNPKTLNEFIAQRISAGITAEVISPMEFVKHTPKQDDKLLIKRTLLPKGEYDSPVEIDIFGDNVAFIDYDNDGMSTLIESRNIADAMRQVFQFAGKHVRLSSVRLKPHAQVSPLGLRQPWPNQQKPPSAPVDRAKSYDNHGSPPD